MFFPSVFQPLLHEFKDVFQDEVPKGLPRIRCFEHKIDFIPWVTIPNRPAYRDNPTEKFRGKQRSSERRAIYMREFESMFCTNLIGVKERWNVAHVSGL